MAVAEQKLYTFHMNVARALSDPPQIRRNYSIISNIVVGYFCLNSYTEQFRSHQMTIGMFSARKIRLIIKNKNAEEESLFWSVTWFELRGIARGIS